VSAAATLHKFRLFKPGRDLFLSLHFPASPPRTLFFTRWPSCRPDWPGQGRFLEVSYSSLSLVNDYPIPSRSKAVISAVARAISIAFLPFSLALTSRSLPEAPGACPGLSHPHLAEFLVLVRSRRKILLPPLKSSLSSFPSCMLQSELELPPVGGHPFSPGPFLVTPPWSDPQLRLTTYEDNPSAI